MSHWIRISFRVRCLSGTAGPHKPSPQEIKELIDFSFMYSEVKEAYGENGNVSVPPPVILKLMLLLVFYNVRSETGADGDAPRAAGLALVLRLHPR